MSKPRPVMTTDDNARELADQCARRRPLTAIVGWENALMGIRDDATVRGIFREWLNRLERRHRRPPMSQD